VSIFPGLYAGLVREALGWADACIELIETRAASGAALLHFDPRAWIYSGRGTARALLGDLAGALADSDRALELARERDDFDRYLAHWIRSSLDSWRGDSAGALEHGRKMHELGEKAGGPQGRVHPALGIALGRIGEWGDALPLLEAGRAARHEVDFWIVHPGLPSALLHCGEPERALAVSREDIAYCASRGIQVSELQLQIELVEVAARCATKLRHAPHWPAPATSRRAPSARCWSPRSTRPRQCSRRYWETWRSGSWNSARRTDSIGISGPWATLSGWQGSSAYECAETPVVWLGRSDGATGRNLAKFAGETLLRSPEVVSRLQPQPQIRPVAAELSEPQCHLGRYGRHAGEDTVQRLPRHPQLSGGLTDREIQRRQHVVPEYLSGMRRRELRRVTGLDLSHG